MPKEHLRQTESMLLTLLVSLADLWRDSGMLASADRFAGKGRSRSNYCD
jgi:hypothetical protein